MSTQRFDTVFANLQPVLASARNAASPYVPLPGATAQFPGYKQWLDTSGASIRSGTDPSEDPGFIQASSDARTELSPYFPPTRDVDLQQAQLDPRYLFFFSDQLFGLFCDQTEDIRNAAADYLSQNYAIPYTPELLP
jgi:hypothetical protein